MFRSGSKGFLLFEVLISIVIISAGLLTISRSYSSSRDAIERSTDLVKTVILLENAMFEFEEKGEIGEFTVSGDFKGAMGYAWRMNAEGIENSGNSLVRLDVFRKEKPETTKYSIVTYLRGGE